MIKKLLSGNEMVEEWSEIRFKQLLLQKIPSIEELNELYDLAHFNLAKAFSHDFVVYSLALKKTLTQKIDQQEIIFAESVQLGSRNKDLLEKVEKFLTAEIKEFLPITKADKLYFSLLLKRQKRFRLKFDLTLESLFE